MKRFFYLSPLIFLASCLSPEQIKDVQQTIADDVLPEVIEHGGEIITQAPGAATGNPVSIIAIVVAGVALVGGVLTRIFMKKQK